MDERTNQLQRIFDFNMMDNQMLSISVHDNSHQQDLFALNRCHQSGIQDKSDFFAEPSNPFEGSRKISFQGPEDIKPLDNQQKESFKKEKLKFEEVQASQEYFFEEKSSKMLYEQSSTEAKKQSEECILKKKLKKGIKHKNQLKAQQVKGWEEQNFEIITRQKIGSLKNLSEIIYQIIEKCGSLTFNSLVLKVIEFHRQQQAERGIAIDLRNKKNIQRRAYDSLKVMVQAGIVEKTGKRRMGVHLKDSPQKPVFFKTLKDRQNSKSHLTNLREKMLKCQMNLESKRKIFQQLTNKRLALQRFFKDKLQIKTTVQSSQSIEFPFVCVVMKQGTIYEITHIQRYKSESCWEKDNQSTRDSFDEENQVSIVFKQINLFDGILIEGDVDFIERVGKLNQIKMED